MATNKPRPRPLARPMYAPYNSINRRYYATVRRYEVSPREIISSIRCVMFCLLYSRLLKTVFSIDNVINLALFQLITSYHSNSAYAFGDLLEVLPFFRHKQLVFLINLKISLLILQTSTFNFENTKSLVR